MMRSVGSKGKRWTEGNWGVSRFMGIFRVVIPLQRGKVALAPKQ